MLHNGWKRVLWKPIHEHMSFPYWYQCIVIIVVNLPSISPVRSRMLLESTAIDVTQLNLDCHSNKDKDELHNLWRVHATTHSTKTSHWLGHIIDIPEVHIPCMVKTCFGQIICYHKTYIPAGPLATKLAESFDLDLWFRNTRSCTASSPSTETHAWRIVS